MPDRRSRPGSDPPGNHPAPMVTASTPQDLDAFFLELVRNGFTGEIRRDLATRVVHATDNSIYQFMPAAVVHVRTAEDIARMLRLGSQVRFRQLSFSARGGGTGTNAQSLTDGIVVDYSKYLNHIHTINPEEGWVEVDPGVILDALNTALRPHGVFFAPNVSTSSRATLGGMISTDACGQGSRIYGRTSNHTLGLQVVLADGSSHWIEPWGPDELNGIVSGDPALSGIVRTVKDVLDRQADEIERIFPRLNRFLTGYNLAHVTGPGKSFNLVPLICGSEGTLAMVVRARLRLTPLPRFRQIVVLKYARFLDALDDATPLAAYQPAAVETLDEKILERLREDEIFPRVRELLGADVGLGTGATNFVEFTGDDAGEIDNNARRLLQAIEAAASPHPKVIGVLKTDHPGEIADLWEVRKRGVGLLGNLPGRRKPVAFVEDTAVPPEELGAFVRSFRKILDAHGLDYGMYGHVDAGCLHVRPALDLADPADEALVRTISDEIARLVKKHHGIMWGEHGRGLRSVYTPDFFGADLHRELRRIKEAFDPGNRLNPGKIVTPLSRDEAVRPVDSPLRGQADRTIPADLREAFEKAFDCNGNGACFTESVSSVMCPSYKATRDRIHSPKGRAMVMREWLRQGRPVKGVFASEVRDAMAGCLACKACVTQCPIHVDVPDFKARFQDAYYRGNSRPLRDRLVGGFERIAGWVGRLAPVARRVGQSSPARAVLEKIGLVDMPAFSVPNLSRRMKADGIPFFSRLPSKPGGPEMRTVVLLQDAFTSLFEPEVVVDTCRLIRRLGCDVRIHPYFENGKALHIKGYLDRLREVIRKNLALLEPLQTAGFELVAIEPSVALTYRDEYVRFGPPEAARLKVLTLQEWLLGAVPFDGNRPAESDPPDAILLPHCMESAGAPHLTSSWKTIFERLGCTLKIEAVGCCGMAGIYGHESEHAAISRTIFERQWRKHLQTGPGIIPFLATGFSCRHQAARCSADSLRHPVSFLADRLVE